MKKLLICLLLLPSLAWGGETQEYARMNPYVLGAGVSAAGGTCSSYVLEDSNATGDGSFWFCKSTDTSRNKVATSFTATGTTGHDYTVQRISQALGNQGSPTCTLIASVCNDNGSGLPGSTCTKIGEVDCTGLTSWDYYDVTQATIGSGKGLVNGTKYHIVLDCNGYGSDTDYPMFIMDNTETGQSISIYGSSWSEGYADRQGKFRAYSCTP